MSEPALDTGGAATLNDVDAVPVPHSFVTESVIEFDPAVL